MTEPFHLELFGIRDGIGSGSLTRESWMTSERGRIYDARDRGSGGAIGADMWMENERATSDTFFISLFVTVICV